jgi:hypothetical protein
VHSSSCLWAVGGGCGLGVVDGGGEWRGSGFGGGMTEDDDARYGR